MRRGQTNFDVSLHVEGAVQRPSANSLPILFAKRWTIPTSTKSTGVLNSCSET
jgi:hypothetical protein